MTVLVYLARPIDLDDRSGSGVWAEWIAEFGLGKYDLALFDPSRAFRIPAGAVPNGSVSRIDRHALTQCRGLIAINPEAHGVGTAMEIEMAQSLGLPALVLSSERAVARSWSLAGLSNCRLVGLPDPTSPKEVPHAVAAIEAGLRWLGFQAKALEQSVTHPLPEIMRVMTEHDQCMMPTRPFRGDAGFDLYVSEQRTVHPDAFVDVPCGIAVQLPPGVWGFITSRSSTLRKHNLLVSTGVIDNGYRGPLYAGVKNLGERDFVVKPGMRLAQLIPLPVMADSIVQVRSGDLDVSERGSAGFGSSGE